MLSWAGAGGKGWARVTALGREERLAAGARKYWPKA